MAKGKKKAADPTASANGAPGPQKMTRKEFERKARSIWRCGWSGQ